MISISMKQIHRIDLSKLPAANPMHLHDLMFLSTNPNMEELRDFWAGQGKDMTDEEVFSLIHELYLMAKVVEYMLDVLPHRNLRVSKSYTLTGEDKAIIDIYETASIKTEQDKDKPPQPVVSFDGSSIREVNTYMCMVFTSHTWLEGFMSSSLVQQLNNHLHGEDITPVLRYS